MDMVYAAGPAPVTVGEPTTFRYRLTADADPGLLSRILQIFAKRSLVPETFQSERLPDDLLEIEVTVPTMPVERALHVAACLRETVGVRRVHGPAGLPML